MRCPLTRTIQKWGADHMNQSTAMEKSKAFAIRIIRMYQYLIEKKHEYVLSKQVLRSGTSIGANIAEATCASSRKDFAAKLYIAFKECSETLYWLELLYETDYITEAMYRSIRKDCDELYRLLSASTRTVRKNVEPE